MGLFTWMGRMILWLPPFTPIGIWRSMRHHRRKAVKQLRDELQQG